MVWLSRDLCLNWSPYWGRGPSIAGTKTLGLHTCCPLTVDLVGPWHGIGVIYKLRWMGPRTGSYALMLQELEPDLYICSAKSLNRGRPSASMLWTLKSVLCQ
jgi:hypothetical protein